MVVLTPPSLTKGMDKVKINRQRTVGVYRMTPKQINELFEGFNKTQHQLTQPGPRDRDSGLTQTNPQVAR
jgi:hypothetical protein